MNCKPNEMAIVVGEDDDCLCNIGATLRVVQVVAADGLEPMWLITEESRPLKLTTNGGMYPERWSTECECYMADRYLVPWRNPRDDAIDWVSHRTPRSVDLREDELTRARRDLQEQAS